MTFGREAVHVDADLGNDDPGAEIADAGDGAQDLDRAAKGLDMGVDLLIDLADGGVDRIDMLEEQPQHKPMMVSHPATQRRLKLGLRCPDAPVGQDRQCERIGLTGDQSLDHPAAGEAHDVGDDRIELDVGILQRLLDPLDMTAPLTDELLAGSQEIAHLLRRLVRDEAASDQPMCHQIG